MDISRRDRHTVRMSDSPTPVEPVDPELPDDGDDDTNDDDDDE